MSTEKIILSAFSDEYALSFDKQLEAMARLGIGWVELRAVDGKNVSVLTEKEVAEVKAKLAYYGIGVSAIGSPIGKTVLDGDLGGHFDMARRVFETAKSLGTENVRIFSFYAPEGKRITEMKDRVFLELSKLARIAREYGIVLCHENEAKIYGDTPLRCKEIYDTLGGEIKLVFDMGNYVLEGVDPYPESYGLLRDGIRYFHIKDALFEGAIVPPGKGNAKIGEILKAHSAYADKPFFVTLEPHLQLFSGLNALVGRSFDNPYKYDSCESAFEDALGKIKELIL